MSDLHPRREEIIDWLRMADVPHLTGWAWQRLWEASYPTWNRSATAWDRQLATGGTYTLRAIMWYQHVHRPGSTDSRPGVILDAITATMDADVSQSA